MLKLAILLLAITAATHPLTAGTIQIRPIQVCDDSGLNCANGARELFEAEGDKIWAQANLDLMFLSWFTLNETDYLNVDLETDELDNLWMTAADPNPLVVSMYFVNSLFDPGGITYGIAAFPGNRAAIANDVFTFNGGNGRRDTIAHELGHNLGLPHTDDNAADYLLTAGSFRSIPGGVGDITPDGAGLSKLSAVDLAIVAESPLIVPEPSTVLLSMAGLAFIAWRRVRPGN